MAHLENQVVNNHPQCIDSTIIDAMFFLHLQKNLPETYQAVSRSLFVKIVNTKGRFIHFVSDKNISPSIKDAERNNRSSGRSSLFHEAIGGSQKRPINWGESLRNSKFKNSFIQYLLAS